MMVHSIGAWVTSPDAPDKKENSIGKSPSDTWVVVADGGKARMLSNVGGEGNALSLKQDQVLDAQDMDAERPSGHQPPRDQ
jgi:hypothetical protein